MQGHPAVTTESGLGTSWKNGHASVLFTPGFSLSTTQWQRLSTDSPVHTTWLIKTIAITRFTTVSQCQGTMIWLQYRIGHCSWELGSRLIRSVVSSRQTIYRLKRLCQNRSLQIPLGPPQVTPALRILVPSMPLIYTDKVPHCLSKALSMRSMEQHLQLFWAASLTGTCHHDLDH